MRKYHHLLGSFKIGEKDQATALAQEQFEVLLKQGELMKGKNMAYVEIKVFLVDHTPDTATIDNKDIKEDKTQ